MELHSTVEFLGGKKTLKRNISNLDQLLVTVREGFYFPVLSTVCARLDVTEKSMVEKIALSHRTAARRLVNKDKLKADESDKLMRIVRIAQEAEVILGSPEKSRQWLKTPLTALGGKTPFSMMDTDLGAAEVEVLLTRIEEGIIS